MNAPSKKWLHGSLINGVTKAIELTELVQVAKARGYREGWVAHEFRRRNGHWPWEAVSRRRRASIEFRIGGTR